KRLVKIKYISLVNLIVDRPLVKELIQGEFNTQLLYKELKKILKGTDREIVKTGYRELRKKLGNSGASMRTAERVIAFLNK
ncbi:MAG: lipid-A-disaccharide synthase, partial [Bacteroidota bacterium]